MGHGPTTGATAKAASIRSSRRRPAEQAFDGRRRVEQLLLDGDELAKGCDYWDIRKVAHSPDHRLVAFAVDDKGSEFYTLHVRECGNGREIETIRDTYGEFVWGEDSTIDLLGGARRECAPRRRVLPDARPGTDELVYREADPGFFIGIQKSQSRKFIFVTANDHTTIRVALSAHGRQRPCADARSPSASAASIIPSSISTDASGSAPTATARSISRWSLPRTNSLAKKTGASRSRTGPAC